MTFGKRLKELRLEKGINQIDFAKIFNVAKGTVSNWESDNRFPDKEMLIDIAKYFDVSLDYLLTGKVPAGTSELTAKDKKDIAKDLELIMAELQEGNALAYGDAIDPRDIPTIEAGLNIILEQIKTQNKQKYTPNKYK